MDTVDAGIPLQAGRSLPQFGPDYNALAQMQRTAIAVDQARQVQQAQNALKTLYANPQNFDPKTLQPTPDAFSALARAAPGAAMDLRNNLVTMQEKQARASFTTGEIAKEYRDQARDVAARSISAYEGYLKTMPPESAMRKTQEEIYTPAVNDMKQGMPTELASRMSPTFDPIRARSVLADAKSLESERVRQRERSEDFTVHTDHGQERPTEYKLFKDGHATTMDGRPFRPTGVAEPKGKEAEFYKGTGSDGKEVTVVPSPHGGFRDVNTGEIVPNVTNLHKVGAEKQQTPAAQAFAKFMEEHPTATSAEQTKFIESQRPARSGPAAAVRKYMEENPTASSSDIAAFNAWQRETSAGAQAFGTGTQGNLVRAQDVAVDHLSFLGDDLVPALKNGDVQAINRVKNWAKTQFGYEGPVDFNFAKGIVSQEVNKSIVNVGAGTGEERENLARGLSDANSPEQLYGVIRSAKRLMGGQLRGLQQQYIDVTVPPDKRGDKDSIERARRSFQQKLFPRTIEELGGMEAPHSGAAAVPAATAAIPPASSGQPMPPPDAANELKDWPAKKATPGANGQLIPQARDDAEAEKLVKMLPENSQFYGPDGKIYVKH